MSKMLKGLNRTIADAWVAGNAGVITLNTNSASGDYFFVYSGNLLVDGFRLCYLKQVEQAIKGAGWNTRHAQAIGAGLREHPIHSKAMGASTDLRFIYYMDKRGRPRYVRTEAGMNTPAVMLYLAYRRYSNRLNRQIESLRQAAK